jgi:hypothetical protein
MMMNAFALDCGCDSLGSFGVVCGRGVFELSCLTVKSCSDVLRIGMFEFFMLHTCHLVAMLLRKNFTVLDRLDGGVEMILINLPIYCGGDILMSHGLDLFVLDSWSLPFVNGRVMMTTSTDEFGYRSFGFIHRE